MRAATPFTVLAALLASPLPAADLAAVKQRGTLRVVTAGAPGSVDTPANIQSRFLFVKGGVLRGIEGEILTGFARLHGVRVEMVRVGAWERLIPTLLQDRGDPIAAGVTDTPGRRQQIEFTAETFPTRSVVVTRKPHRVVRTLDELREERIGVSRATAYVEQLLAAGVPRERMDEAFSTGGGNVSDALKEGRVTAIVEGVETALISDADPALQLGMFLGPPQSLAFGVRKEDVALRDALNKYLANIRRTPTYNRLVVKYFGEKALDVLKKVREP